MMHEPKNKDELISLINDTSIPLQDIDIHNCTDLSGIFKNSPRKDFTGLDRWDVSHVMNMAEMFANCPYFKDDLYNWDVSSVKNMDSMFENCTGLNGKSLEHWNTPKLQSANNTFKGCKNLETDFTNWETPLLTSCDEFVKDCPLDSQKTVQNNYHNFGNNAFKEIEKNLSNEVYKIILSTPDVDKNVASEILRRISKGFSYNPVTFSSKDEQLNQNEVKLLDVNFDLPKLPYLEIPEKHVALGPLNQYDAQDLFTFSKTYCETVNDLVLNKENVPVLLPYSLSEEKVPNEYQLTSVENGKTIDSENKIQIYYPGMTLSNEEIAETLNELGVDANTMKVSSSIKDAIHLDADCKLNDFEEYIKNNHVVEELADCTGLELNNDSRKMFTDSLKDLFNQTLKFGYENVFMYNLENVLCETFEDPVLKNNCILGHNKDTEDWYVLPVHKRASEVKISDKESGLQFDVYEKSKITEEMKMKLCSALQECKQNYYESAIDYSLKSVKEKLADRWLRRDLLNEYPDLSKDGIPLKEIDQEQAIKR